MPTPTNRFYPTATKGDSFERTMQAGDVLLDANGVPLQTVIARPRPPTAADCCDSVDFQVTEGTTWYDSANGVFYICSDATANAAVWETLSTSGSTSAPTPEYEEISYNADGTVSQTDAWTDSGKTTQVTTTVYAYVNGNVSTATTTYYQLGNAQYQLTITYNADGTVASTDLVRL